jgi:hypothetical protein
MSITLSHRRITWVLATIVLCLLLASTAGQLSKHLWGHDRLWGFVRLFDLDQEGNVPTWYQAMALLVCAGLLTAITRHRRRLGAPYAVHWTVLAVIFLGLSIDEAASIHEMAVHPLRAAWHTRGIFYFAWVIPGGAFVLLVGLAYLPFLAALPGPTRRLFIAAGALYVGGAVGMELVEGYVVEGYVVEGYHGTENLAFIVASTVEEGLEMVGIVIFIRALMGYLGDTTGTVELRFGSPQRGRVTGSR